MGLDVDLVKFEKPFFDKNSSLSAVVPGRSSVDYHDGHDEEEPLYDYRKYYEVKNLIVQVLGGTCDQTTYYPLSRDQLKSFRRLSVDLELSWPDEMAEFLGDVDTILETTNFDTHVIAFIWIS